MGWCGGYVCRCMREWCAQHITVSLMCGNMQGNTQLHSSTVRGVSPVRVKPHGCLTWMTRAPWPMEHGPKSLCGSSGSCR